MNPPQQAKAIKRKMEEVLETIIELRKHREAMVFLALEFYSNLEQTLKECLAQEPVELTAPYLLSLIDRWSTKNPKDSRMQRIPKIQEPWLQAKAIVMESRINDLIDLIVSFTHLLGNVTYVQHSRTVRTPQGTVRLRICYGTSLRKDTKNPFEKLAFFVGSKETIRQGMQEIDNTIEDALRSIAERTTLFETVLGGSSKEVTIYIVQTEDAAGFIGKMEKVVAAFLNLRRTFRISEEFDTTSEDIRMFVEVGETYRPYSPVQLQKILTHEITHILDKNIAQYTTYANKIRAEAIAVFAELIHSPAYITKYDTLFRTYFNRPLSIFGKKEAELKAQYELGPLMLLQLFAQSVGKEDEIEYAVIKRNYVKINDLFFEKETNARAVLQAVKLMDTKQFFQYYLAKVNNPLLTRALVKRLIGGR